MPFILSVNKRNSTGADHFQVQRIGQVLAVQRASLHEEARRSPREQSRQPLVQEPPRLHVLQKKASKKPSNLPG